jgi:hypothetical protein
VTAAAILGTALTLPASAQLDPADDNPGQLGGGEQPVYVPQPVWKPEIQPLPEPDGGPEGADVENPGVIRAKPVVTKPKPTVPQKANKPAATTPAKSQKGSGKQAAESKSAHGSDGRSGAGAVQSSDVVRQTAEGGAAKVTAFWSAARAAWGEWWESVPVKNRPWIIGSTVGGLAVGTVLGLLLPTWSAGAVTALAGSAIWLPAALWLGTAWGLPGFVGKGAGLGGLSTGGWIAVWLVVASIGVACQWYGLMPAGKGKKGKGKKKAKKPADEDE